MDSLSLTEQQRLDELEAQIEEDKQAFIRVGQAMLEIKERRLYRERFPSWETYCQQRWQFSGRQGYYQLAAITKGAEIAQTNPPFLPTHESQTRPLTKDFSVEESGLIWRRAIEQAGNAQPTQKIVKEQRDRFLVEQSRYPYVHELVNNCSLAPDKAAALVVALDSSPDKPCRDWLVESEVRDPSLALDLVRLYRDKRESANELRVTKAIQSSTRTVLLKNASVSDLRTYLDERAREHQAEARERKNADRNIRIVSAFLYVNDPEQTYQELQRVLTDEDLRGLQSILNSRVR